MFDPFQPDDEDDVPAPTTLPAAPANETTARTLEAARSAPTPRFPAAPLPPLILGGSVNIIGGAPFAGKTPLMAWFIRQFLEGSVLGHAVPAGAVSEHVFVTVGSWLNRTREWFDGLPVRAYSVQDDLAFNPERLTRRGDRVGVLIEALDQLQPKPGALVWIDPLTAFFSGSLIDPDVCFTHAALFHRLALLRQITVIGTAVASKQKISAHERQTTLLNRIAGSASFFGYLDTCFYLAPPSELERETHTLGVYPRFGPSALFDLKQDEATGHFGYATPLEAYAAFQATIPTSPASISTGELEALLCPPTGSLSRATLFRQLRSAVAHGAVIQVRRGVYQRPRAS